MATRPAYLPADPRYAVIACVALAIAAALVGYWVGSLRHGLFEAVGTAHSTDLQISIESDGWTYDVPLAVQWTDGNGGWHEGDRPDCLPPTTGEIAGIRFSAVPVETRGLGFRQVIAVHCG
jgi:hypothetical protein